MLMKGKFEGFIIKSANQSFFISREGRIRGNRLSLQKERFRVDIRRNFLMVRVTQVGVQHCGKWVRVHPCAQSHDSFLV